MILTWYLHFKRIDGLNKILRSHSIISTLFLQPTAYRFAFCFNFIFTATPRSTYLSRAAETQREMLARHHAMTAGEKVSRWLSGDRRVEEDSDVIGSISSSEEHGMYIN
jgi:hypothetical protein